MNNQNNKYQYDDFSDLEEKLRKDRKSQNKQKISGKSVFDLQKIITQKRKNNLEHKDTHE